jgi:hypothetical protein
VYAKSFVYKKHAKRSCPPAGPGVIKKMKNLYYLLLFSTIFIIQACSTPYYGHTKDQWNNFSETEKISIKTKYKTITNIRNAQSHTNKINERTQSVIDYGVSKEQ